MELLTDRLILHEYTKKDNHCLYKLFSEDFISAYVEHLPKSLSAIDDYIDLYLENSKFPKRTHYFYAIRLRESQEFVGCVGYSFVEEIVINDTHGSVMELEYYLLEKHWGKGFATEAVRRIISSTSMNGNTVKIIAQCHKNNHESEKVLIKCGMVKSKNQPNPKLYNGVLLNNVRYEICINR